MTAQRIVNTLLEANWQPPERRVLCHHHWITSATDETQPGMKVITQTCPECGKQRVLNRRVLPKLPRKPMHERPPKSNCSHVWIGLGQAEDPVAGLMKYTHECPKCKRIKTTVRRMLPPRA